MGIYVFAGLFILAGYGLFKTYLRARRMIAASQNWVSAPGTFEQIEYRERKRKNKLKFRLKMLFVYTVGGRKYEADESRIAFSESRSTFGTREDVEKAIAKWKSKQPLMVFHDPADPANCVLELEKPGKEISILLVSLMFLAMGSGILVHKHWNEIAPLLQQLQ